jgi:hypothetical protein
MKTGGSTVSRRLRQVYPVESRFPVSRAPGMMNAKGSPSYLIDLPAQQRDALRWLCPHMPFSVATHFQTLVPQQVSTTVLLRDGLDRAISHLSQVSRRLKHAYTYRQLLDAPVLGEFFFSNHQTRAMAAGPSAWDEWERCFTALWRLEDHLADPDSSFPVSSVGPADFEVARETLSQVDVLGFQDEFSDWWQRCRQRYGWPGEPAAENVGAEKETGPAPPITDAIIGELRERNELDSQLYNAAKDLVKS